MQVRYFKAVDAREASITIMIRGIVRVRGGGSKVVGIEPVAGRQLLQGEEKQMLFANGSRLILLPGSLNAFLTGQACTRAAKPGEYPRAGRWWWENSQTKECGLHFRSEELLSAVNT